MKFVLILSFFVLSVFAEKIEGDWQSDVEDIGLFQAIAIQYIATYDEMQCPNSTIEKLKKENENAIECVRNIRHNSTFCETFVHHFKPCVQGLLDEVKKCADPIGFLFINTILDSSIEEAKYICDVDGEHILAEDTTSEYSQLYLIQKRKFDQCQAVSTFVNQEMFNPCVLKSVKSSYECRKNITEPIADKKNPIVICSAFPSLQKCFESQMHQECGNELTRTALHDLFSVDVKPCNVIMMIYFELAAFLV